MKIILVDDNKEYRKSLRKFIEEYLKSEVVAEYDDGADFMNWFGLKADIVLMDINMPGINGLETTKKSIWRDQNIKIIAVSQHSDYADLQELIEVGFKGFVSKTNLFRDLKKAMDMVLEGGYFFPDEIEVELK